MTEFNYLKDYLVFTSLSTIGNRYILMARWYIKLFACDLHTWRLPDIKHLLIIHSGNMTDTASKMFKHKLFSKFPWHSPTSEKVAFLNKRKSKQFKNKCMLLRYPCALTIHHINAVFLKKNHIISLIFIFHVSEICFSLWKVTESFITLKYTCIWLGT